MGQQRICLKLALLVHLSKKRMLNLATGSLIWGEVIEKGVLSGLLHFIRLVPNDIPFYLVVVWKSDPLAP
jgi:hypothetical protein